MSEWPWPATGRLLETGPLPEHYPGYYPDAAKEAWRPWVDAARAGASLAELKVLEPLPP